MEVIKGHYERIKCCVKVGGVGSKWFQVRVGSRKGYVMSPWLFNIYTVGVVNEVKVKWMERLRI